MGDYPQAQNQGGQPPAFRRGLLQALLGLGTGGTDTDPENRIEGDPATRANQDLTPVGQSTSQRPAAGSTSDLENRASAGRLTLAEQMRMGGEGGQALGATPPDHLQDLQSQYDRLNPTPQPMTLKQKLLKGALGAATGFLGGPRVIQEQERQREFQQNQRREQSQNLLSQIEAERRMQQTGDIERDRMTLQQQMEQDRLRQQQEMAQPEHMDTDQGPVQYNRQTRQWEPITVGGQRVGPKAQKSDSLQMQYDAAVQSGNKARAGQLLQEMSDIGAATQKPEREPAGGVGTWQLSEDNTGKPVLFNSKTGQTKDAPNIQKPGTYQKQFGGASESLQYANDYMQSGNFTGTGDEALMEKFFDLAKPSSGFRMTQPQMDMLNHARDAVQGIKARAKHYLTPSAPYFDDVQRQNIVRTMNDIVKAKQEVQQRGQGGGAQPSLKNKMNQAADPLGVL